MLKKSKEGVASADHLLTPTMRSALKACKLAESMPGCLVRVTLNSPAEFDTVAWTENSLRNVRLLAADKTIAGCLKEGAAVMELNNGSGIEFAIKGVSI